MAGTSLRFTQEFTNATRVEVAHSLGRRDLYVRLLIDGEIRNDLIRSVEFETSDEDNKLTLTLASAQTGVVQIITADMVPVTMPVLPFVHLEDQTTGVVKKVYLDDGALRVER